MKLFGNIYFILNSIILALASIFLSLQIIRKAYIKKNMKNLNDNYNKSMIREFKRYVCSDSSYVAVSLIERVELNLIEKSNIKSYISFASFYSLLLCCIVIFIIAFFLIYKTTLFVPSAIIISVLISLTPVFILDILAKYNSEKVRRKLAGFISILNRWCAVKEDIFYAFEKSLDSGIGEPLETYVRDMLVQASRGVDPLEALNMLLMKVDSSQFKDFIINIKQNVKHRGDIRKLLTNLEEQFYKIEEECNRRKISTYKDRITIYFIMVMVLVVGYTFLKINPQVEQFYLSTYQGKIILMFFSILYALGFYITLGIYKLDI